ncbi:Threonine/homoserine efflux transporter RhtA [Humidesulfovibrio mexicanus]|uniref:Threonine/homoserine efflux transporter RhtA n=1 Tax=Humidesulfovibrio mexicanus TaxID=147047 RepID=A0A238ZET4_9BACT|nr:DMT family transporter [Humidesulfovibrio mexicanus]SNR81790.1 Threonine/homoserine efflux transporter RhtA [Humidesulfovibrio mexicanus]
MASLAGMVCAASSAACFGMLAILGKLAYARGFAPAEILQYRFGLGALLLLVWFAATNRSVLRARPRTILKAAFLGVVLYPVQSLSFMTALKYIPASTTSLILYFYPVAVTLASSLLFKTRLDSVVAMSLLLLIAGCGLVFYDAFLRDINGTGLALATASMLIFSAYLIVLEWLLKGENPQSISFYCVLFAAVVYTILSPPIRFPELDMESKLLTLALGIVPTALAVTLLYRAVELIGSASASICSTLEPITTVLASALLLGEAVVPVQLAGMALILVGIVLPNAQALRLRRP